jgi:hypothetical protein
LVTKLRLVTLDIKYFSKDLFIVLNTLFLTKFLTSYLENFVSNFLFYTNLFPRLRSRYPTLLGYGSVTKVFHEVEVLS